MLILLTGPKPKEIKVETFRIDYLIRGPKVEKLSFQPISLESPESEADAVSTSHLYSPVSALDPCNPRHTETHSLYPKP